MPKSFADRTQKRREIHFTLPAEVEQQTFVDNVKEYVDVLRERPHLAPFDNHRTQIEFGEINDGLIQVTASWESPKNGEHRNDGYEATLKGAIQNAASEMGLGRISYCSPQRSC
jgi:hypothetical protein